MKNKEATTPPTDTMTVTLEDGSEAQRPYFIQRAGVRVEIEGADQRPSDRRVPIPYAGEEAFPILGGWLIRRLPR
jgi:hypothetical protein